MPTYDDDDDDDDDDADDDDDDDNPMGRVRRNKVFIWLRVFKSETSYKWYATKYCGP